MIAVHTALYIFKPPTLIGEGGTLSVSLYCIHAVHCFATVDDFAGIHKPQRGIYVGGTSCHLPVRPFWYRPTLSWIPRYLIFLFILGTDTSIYLIVMRKFGDYGKSTDASKRHIITQDSVEVEQGEYRLGKGSKRYSVPPIPALAYNGLIPDTRLPSVVSRTAPNPPVSSPRKCPPKTFGDSSILIWPKLSFQCHVPETSTFSDTAPSVPLTSNVVATFDPFPSETVDTPSPHAVVLTPVRGVLPSAQTSWTTFAARFNSRSPSRVSLISFLRLPRNNSSFLVTAQLRFTRLNLSTHRAGTSAFKRTKRSGSSYASSLFIRWLTWRCG